MPGFGSGGFPATAAGFRGGGFTVASGPPAFVSGSSLGTSSASTITVNAPANIASGNLLVAVFYMNGASATGPAAPAGWTLAGQTLTNSAAGNLSVFTKTATGSEPANYTFTFAAQFGGSGCVILQYSSAPSVDGTPAFTSSSASVASGTAPSVTSAAANEMWVTAFGTQFAAVTCSTPSGFTARTAQSNASFSTIVTFEKSLTSSGATGTASTTFTGGPTGYCSLSVLLS